MLFNSIHFFLFFLVVTTLYFALPHSKRWILLLISSCYFYMSFVPIYILILGFTIVIDYFAAIYIDKAKGKLRKTLLIVSLFANIGVLVFFKYFNFLNDNLTAILNTFTIHNPIPALKILLPIGLSFHTFQAMSYTIEVYRGHQKAERHFGIYSLYVMFYPQLVAGPIERPQNLLHQFRDKFDFDYDRVTSGLRLMAWGLFKKIVIADRLAAVVDYAYADPTTQSSLALVIATFFFAFQILCDFSGYSDMAIGAARVMGFKLMKNFDAPYRSKSVAEFWKRWHISLSTWFKDYLYITLGGNRVSIPRWYLNLIIVFLISGLWHGANWTFIVWGAIHGFYMVCGAASADWRKKISLKYRLNQFPILSIFGTFILINFAWIFFRADTLAHALFVIRHLPGGILQAFYYFNNQKILIDHPLFSPYNLVLCFSLIFFLILVQYLQKRFDLVKLFLGQPVAVRWAIYAGLIFTYVFYGVFEDRQFIYFQF